MNLRNKALLLLRKIGLILKIDMVYLTRSGWWTTLRFAIGTVVSIGTLIAFGNLVSKEVYGTYNYLLSLGASLGFLTLAGTSTAVVRAIARGQENVVHYAIKMQLRYNLTAIIAIGIAAIYYEIHGNTTFALSLGILALALPLSAVYHTYEFIFMGQKRFDLIAVAASISSIIAAVGTITVLFLTDNIVTLVSVYALTSFIPNVAAFLYAQKSLPKTPPDPAAIAELRRTSFHLTGAGIIGTLVQYVDKIVLFQVAGPAALAVYGFAIAGPERLKGLIKNWASVTLPHHAVKTLEEINNAFYARIKLLLLIGVGVAALYILFVPYLFRLLLPNYLESILYSQVYAVGLITIPLVLYTGNIFAGQNMLRATYAFGTGAQVIRILLFLVLGWKWQVWGLVVASILSYSLNAIYGIIILKIESKRLTRRP